MLSKFRTRMPIVPIIVTTAILLVGVELLVFLKVELGIIVIFIGLIGLAFTLVARRSGSSTIERILTLSPRDERDERKIQWAFALVGRMTFVFMTLLGLGTLAVFGTTGLNIEECRFDEIKGQVCTPEAGGFVLVGLVIIVTFFAAALIFAAVISALKKD